MVKVILVLSISLTWDIKVCHLCQRQDGACVKCGECEKAVHVQCAIQHGYNVGFEIMSSLGSEGAAVRAGRFGNHGQGEMIPQVCCPEHNLSHKQWIQLSARDVDNGEVKRLNPYVPCL